ncbi:MAG TPA: hypothetical protein VM939_11540, partial [Gemmatimonadaceae bacterium]|nr:hypothetical protein [Gemmatimonadaceae bacterium]
SDWPGMAARTILWRTITVTAFALMLAGIVKWVRYMFLRRDHAAWSAGTVKAGIPGEDFIDRRRTGAKPRFPDESLIDRRRNP